MIALLTLHKWSMLNTNQSNLINFQCWLLSVSGNAQTESLSCLFLLSVVIRIMYSTQTHISLGQIIWTCWAVETLTLFVRAAVGMLCPNFFTFKTGSFYNRLLLQQIIICAHFMKEFDELYHIDSGFIQQKGTYNIFEVTLNTMTGLYFSELQNDNCSSAQTQVCSCSNISSWDYNMDTLGSTISQDTLTQEK